MAVTVSKTVTKELKTCHAPLVSNWVIDLHSSNE